MVATTTTLLMHNKKRSDTENKNIRKKKLTGFCIMRMSLKII